MKRRHRRQSFRFGPLIQRVRSHVTRLTFRLLRTGLVFVVLCAAIWAVLTKSLPYALAPTQPDLALALNSNNPVALATRAEELGAKLSVLEKQAQQHTVGEGEVRTSEHGLMNSRESLRGEIQKLALRAISNDPLNARAIRLLAEITDGTDQIRMLMLEAFRRSRRELVAAFWLLNDSFYKRDYSAAIYYADILLRTYPQLVMPVFSYLFALADGEREALVAKLATNPAWRAHFFAELPSNVKNWETPLALMTMLQVLGKPVTQKEIECYLDFLIDKNRIELAYNVWLQFLPKTDLDKIGLLANASFEQEPNGLPFDWRLGKGTNALAEIVSWGAGHTDHALHITFSDGRVQFPEISQSVLLKPGRYLFEGQLRGTIMGKRGLRWRLQCLSGSRRVLSETEMLMGQTQQWRSFRFEAEVPNLEECRGQELRLLHDLRSASEQLLFGEVWFRDLRLEHFVNLDME